MSSLRNLINAKCRECIHDPHQAGKWRQQVQACTSPTCPLFPARPQSGQESVQFGPFYDAETLEPTKWWHERKAAN